ncbi:MAG: YhbY family RNA-binding protein [Oscillospiraceae bacterium]|nr:YhbY family RNA-binding protein [Oscillospiraceae bacterium]MBR3354840.1 YhbY family RNA-binding protein [Oscillospiraceae bacterium]
MTTKERATLRSFANTLNAVCYIGKDGLTDSVLDGIRDALTARELIKVAVQENSPYTAREACEEVADLLGAEPIQVIGKKFVIYKRNKKVDQYGIK